MSLLTLVALVLQAVVAIATTATIRRPARASRVATIGGAVALTVALAGIAGAVLPGGDGADRVGAVLVAFVLAVTVLVQAFARGNLRGDPAAGRFAALAAWLAVSAGAAASALDLVVIALAWSAGTAIVIALLGHAGAWGQARIARRRAAVALVTGDAGLWLAVLAVRLDTGTTALDALGSVSPTTAAIAGVGVALAAVSRAAAVPFHGWLPASLAAPTPVSALLHAGFVNAGAVLLLRTAELPSPVAGVVAGTAGAITIVVAGAAMLSRPDVKGRLVHSTAAQMGFMLLACAIGAWSLAIFHVIAHGLFKAASFLGSGELVGKAGPDAASDGAASGDTARAGVVRRPARAAAVAVAALAPVAAAAVLGGTAAASAALLLFTVLAVAVAASGALAGRSGREVTAWLLAAAAAGTGVAYVLATRAFDAWLDLEAPAGAMPWPVALAVAAALGLVAVAIGRSGPAAGLAYAFALGWARPPIPPPTAARSAPSAVPSEYGSRP